MKKFISMVMAAAMVVTMVPATAFAAPNATATTTVKVEPVAEMTVNMVDPDKGGDTNIRTASGFKPELQFTVGQVNGRVGVNDTYEITLKFDGATVVPGSVNAGHLHVDGVVNDEVGTIEVNYKDVDEVEVVVTEINRDLQAGDVVYVKLGGELEKTRVNSAATVTVSGDFGKHEDLVYAKVVDKGIAVELDDDVVKVAPEEVVKLEDIVVKPTAGDVFADVCGTGDEITLEVSKGFEFVYDAQDPAFLTEFANVWTDGIPASKYNEDEITFLMDGVLGEDDLHFVGLKVEATTADAGDVCTLKVKVDGLDAAKVEVAQVVDMKVVMELVDPDEDVPVFYSGVDVNNKGITDDADHEALEVKIYETFAGAWSNHKDFTLSLPEGVYVVAADATEEVANQNWSTYNNIDDHFEKAYIDGGHEYFDFAKRSFNETHVNGKASEISFELTLVADPGFVGDVTLTLEGDAVDTQEVVIAKFVAPMTVKAEQNDVIIDYRYTEVPTAIVVTEAEAGLWDKGLEIGFVVERGDMIQFEEDADFAVNEESEMEITDKTGAYTVGQTAYDSVLKFVVDERSDEEAAVVTIDGIELFMQRNIPAGPYDLEMFYTVDAVRGAGVNYDAQALLGQTGVNACTHTDCKLNAVADVNDYSKTVHEAFINVVTAGRDQDDASFTTKVVVPVGEAYLVAGEKQVALDVPAYINADGYTMLPVRAVATALGIDNNAVQWNQATKTVIIMYGQRIITMTAGESVVYVSGTAIPAAAAVEIVDGRAFLALRDLATTLGVTAINWDAATQTATLN